MKTTGLGSSLARLASLVWLVLLALDSSRAVEQLSNANYRPRYELKFQIELDNSTIIIKETEQQHIFKCQVKLAPIAASAAPVEQQPVVWWHEHHRLKSNWSIVSRDERPEPGKQLQAANQTNAAPGGGNNNNNNNKWPSLLAAELAIDWLKDGQPIEAADPGLVSVVNVSLRSHQQHKLPDKSKLGHLKRPRIEIKNTLNSQQHKLTSRLKLTKLKLADSGRYKCQAKASYRQLPMASNNNNNNNHHDNNLDLDLDRLVLAVDQTLDSNGAFLMIGTRTSTTATSNGIEVGASGEGKQVAAHSSGSQLASGGGQQHRHDQPPRQPIQAGPSPTTGDHQATAGISGATHSNVARRTAANLSLNTGGAARLANPRDTSRLLANCLLVVILASLFLSFQLSVQLHSAEEGHLPGPSRR